MNSITGTNGVVVHSNIDGIAISLDKPTTDLLNWVAQSRDRQKRIEALAKEHVSVATALDVRNKADAELNILCSLLQEYK